MPRINDLSPEEVASVWFTKEEYSHMRELDQIILNGMDRGYNLGDSCIRGLEGRTPRASMGKRILILDGICAVLLEQDDQRAKGECDPEKMATFYMIASTKCKQLAADRAKQDEEAVHGKRKEEHKAKDDFVRRGADDGKDITRETGAVSRFQRFIDRATNRNGKVTNRRRNLGASRNS